MACIAVSEEFFVFCSKLTLSVYAIRGGKKKFAHHFQPSTADDKDDNADKEKTTSGRVDILKCAFSQKGIYFAACTDDKQVIWIDTTSWDLKKCCSLVKRPTGIVIDDVNHRLIVSDKAGDVYWYNLNDGKGESNGSWEIILGHVSMLLAVKLSPAIEYLVTADRDETIRISHYPNSYNTAVYCHGHLDFVTTVEFLQSHKDLLLSGGGDGFLILWNLKTGEPIEKYSLSTEKETPILNAIVSINDDIFVTCESIRQVYHFKIQGLSLTTLTPICINLDPWAIVSNTDKVIVLSGNEDNCELTVLNQSGVKEEIGSDIGKIYQQLKDESMFQGTNWMNNKLSDLRRFGKRKDDNGFLHAGKEIVSSKSGKIDDSKEEIY